VHLILTLSFLFRVNVCVQVKQVRASKIHVNITDSNQRSNDTSVLTLSEMRHMPKMNTAMTTEERSTCFKDHEKQQKARKKAHNNNNV
jgi:hypothetical protein